MKNVITIFRRETAAYFNSPIAYIAICLFVAVLSFIFFLVGNFFKRPEPDIRFFFQFMPWVLAIFVPAFTMRLWSEEKRSGTIELLMTTPLRSWEIVVGKYLAGYVVFAIGLIATMVVPLTVEVVTDLDWGTIMATYVGAFVVTSVYIAIGAWVSTFTQNQIVALLVSIVVAIILTFLGFSWVVNWTNGIYSGLGNFLGWFGTLYHFQEFSKGLISPVGLIYGASVTAFFLILNNVFVEGRKY